MSDVIDYDGLFRVASAGRADKVRSFLEAGANPELCDAGGRKPLDRFQAMGLGGDMGASLAILLQGSLLTPA